MPGASGATVVVSPKMTCKTGPPGPVRTRLFQQYVWLREHSHVSRLVRVLKRLPDGYAMQTLVPMLPTQNTAWVLTDIMETIWTEPPDVVGDVFSHNHYVVERLERLPWEISHTAYDVAKGVMKHWDDLHRCLTHGDTTRLNVMRTDRGWLTLIDPIPATAELPDVWAVDMSKILVSALGYDELLLGLPHDDTQATSIVDVLNEMSDLERDAVRYLACVHVARMLPYHREEQCEALIAIAQRALDV